MKEKCIKFAEKTAIEKGKIPSTEEVIEFLLVENIFPENSSELIIKIKKMVWNNLSGAARLGINYI